MTWTEAALAVLGVIAAAMVALSQHGLSARNKPQPTGEPAMTRMPKPQHMTPQQRQDAAMATVQRVIANGLDRTDTAPKTGRKPMPKPQP